MLSTTARTRLGSSCLLALGAMLRLWFVRHANPFSGDPQIYGNIARNLLHHHVYSFSTDATHLQPTLIRLPGYPLFLAACFLLFGIGNFAAAVWVQVVVDLLACLLLAALARQLFGPRAGVFALALGCLCPFTANYTATPLTETLTLASMSITFFAFDRWREGQNLESRWAWLIGLALAASLLLRPEQALLAIAVVPAMLFVAARRSPPYGEGNRLRRVIAPAVIASLCVLLPLLPWTARNWRTFGVFQPLAPRFATDPGEPIPIGFQRWYRTWAIDFASTEEVYWNYDGTVISLADLPSRAFDSPAQRAQTASLLDDYNRDTTPTPGLDARFAALARDRIRHSAVRYYVLLPAARLANMLLRPRTELTGIQLAWWQWHESHAQATIGTLYAALNLAYLVLGVLGWRRWRRSGANADEFALLAAMTAFVMLRCALLLTLDNSEPRYTLELFPILILCAAALLRDPASQPASASSSHPS